MENQEILKNLKYFFQDESYAESDLPQALEEHKVIIDQDYIGNTLKAAMLDETVLEVRIDRLEQVFLCRVIDHPPEVDDLAISDEVGEEDEGKRYTLGDYLGNTEHLVTTPLEPGLGNFLVVPGEGRQTKLVLRIITSNQAIELGCYFAAKITVSGNKVLQLSFPFIARVLKGARELRVKIPRQMYFDVKVRREGNKRDFTTLPMDISNHGMAMVDPNGKYSDLTVDEQLFLDFRVDDEAVVQVEGWVRHKTKIRKKDEIQYCFGVEFDLQQRRIAAAIEQLVTKTQRYHLKALFHLAEKYDVDYSGW